MRTVTWTDLGRMAYQPVWALQHSLVDARKHGLGADRLLLVEHDPVITLGRRAGEANVLLPPDELAARGIEVHAVERGGDVTYHGPGQLVVYPVLDLRNHRKDVGWYSWSLLATVVRTLEVFGLEAHTRPGRETGVWVGPAAAPHGKIAALGVRIERWVTYHGIALNVDPDLAPFDLIVPCGLPGVRVVSMADQLGRPVTLAEVRPQLLAAFGAVFDVELVAAELPLSRLPGAPVAAAPVDQTGTATTARPKCQLEVAP